MFNLLRYFSISSALVIGIMGLGVGYVVHWYETARLVASAAQKNEAIAAQIVALAWDAQAEFLSSTQERDATRLKQTWQVTDIDLAVRQAALRLPVYKVKIFKPDGLTLYSSDLSEVGAKNDVLKREFSSALAGKPASMMKHVPSTLGMGGRLKDIESVETYMPKFDSKGNVIGIIEVYADVTAPTSTIAGMMRSAVLFSIGVCMLLYASLYAVVSRADRLIKTQYRNLSGFNERLEAEVAHRTKLMVARQRVLANLVRSPRFQNGSMDDAFAALNEGATEILDVERCGVYVPIAGASEFEVIDVYDRRTCMHSGRFSRPASYFMSGVKPMAEGEMVCIADVETSTIVQRPFLEYYRELSIRAAMDVPIFIDGRQAGILCFRKAGHAHEWRADERFAAGALATLAALVIQRSERERAEALVLASTTRLARQQAALTDIAARVAMPSHNLEDVLRPMLETLTVVSGSSKGGIWIVAEDRNSFSYAETYSAATGKIESAQVHNTFNIAALDLHTDVNGPVSVPDVREHPLLAKFYEADLARLGVVALLRAPIVMDGVLLGFVSCAASTPTEWTAEQSLFVMGVANMTALAIERHQRWRAERQITANAEALSRQQTVLNELLHSESFRNGSMSAAMRKLSRTLAEEAGIDRVAITVRATDSAKIEYAEAYVAAKSEYVEPYEGSGYDPLRMLSAARAGIAIIADNVETHPDTRQYLDKLFRPIDVRSFLQMPIEVGGAVVGMINATVCGRSIAWSTSQKMFATAIGNLAALTIERNQRQRYQRAVASVAARLEVQQAAITNFMSDEGWRRGGLVDAVQKLSKLASDTIGVERVSIWKMPAGGNAITALDVYDQRSDLHTNGLTLMSSGHPGYFAALQHDGIISSDDVANDQRLSSLQSVYFPSVDVRSMLNMPILMDGAIVGVVVAEKCGEPIAWSEEHRLFLSAVTGLVALVIERLDRKRAEDEMSDGARRLARMLESFSALMQSDVVRRGSLEETLRELSRTLCEEIDVDRTAVLLIESRGNAVVTAEAYARASGSHEAALFPPNRGWPEISASIDIASNLAIADVEVHADFMANEKDLVASQGLGSLLQVPIVIDGVVTGAIRATTIGRKVNWSAEACLFAAAIAQLASLAVERNTRQRVERDLRHANLAAEQANRAKSQFLANMSHEIRTPMNGVFGMTEILIKSPLSDRQRRQVGTIHDSAKTLLTIVNDILDLARIEDGKMPIDAQPFDLHYCIESVAELFAEDAQRKGLELRTYIAPGTPTHIIGDSGRLRQVCVNLISNAIKFTKRGSVDVRLSGTVRQDGMAQLVIEILDTGIGIDQSSAARLFDPFTQADSSISRRFGGTGLGLSISRHLIWLMGGTVTLGGRLDHGTRVLISLACAVATAPVSAHPGIDVLQGQRILVVDDRDTNREIIVDYLASAGALPVNARTGEMALEILDAALDAGHPFAAVVVDMLMPDMDGMSVCQAVRGNALLSATGLVMVTSMTWDGDLQLANSLGITRLLTKPVRRSDLLEAVARAVVEPRPSESPAVVPHVPSAKLKAHVLVAEDNPVNEEVIRELLMAMGCTMRVANNGRAACAAFEAETFDIVLMDCQMPEMDGLTATQRLRQHEQTAARPRTPVIAVTAHAFDADRIACRKAGMDDYLMKPFTEGQLAHMLTRWLKPQPDSAKAEIAKDTKASEPSGTELPLTVAVTSGLAGLDHAFLNNMRVHRPQLYQRLLSAYITHSPGNVGQLLDALAAKQSDALFLAAHSLKSSSANVGAKRIAELARQIEAGVRSGSIEDVTPLVDDLRIEFGRTQAALQLALQQSRTGT